mgnify:CR=1 FL=1
MPKLVQWIFPRRGWAVSRKEPNVYLTFDDGPIPEVTPWVLDELKKHNAKATFYEISDDEKLSNEDINFIEKEFNYYMLENNFDNLFLFPKFKDFVKSVTSEVN